MLDLLQRNNDEKLILKKLFELYPDQKKSKKGYISVLATLRSMDLERSDCVITLTNYEEDGENWVSVDGVEDGTSYAIEYTPWAQWLGMRVDSETLKEFSEVEILARCLWEMTWSGFDEEEIQGTIQEINTRAREIMDDFNG